MSRLNQYVDADHIRQRIANGEHRQCIGGLWDELGALQLDYLKSEGLAAHHRFIDIGCGTFRAGVPLTAFLDPGHYYGIDLRPELIEAGYEREIEPAGLAAKLPRGNLHATGTYDLAPFGTMFDYAIAQSVFTHIPAGELSACLDAIAPFFAAGGRFYVTYFERPESADPHAPLAHEPGGITTYPDRDPFDMTRAQLEAASRPGWRLEIVGAWNHPRDQRMARFIRTG